MLKIKQRKKIAYFVLFIFLPIIRYFCSLNSQLCRAIKYLVRIFDLYITRHNMGFSF